jgi:hypothetical protein
VSETFQSYAWSTGATNQSITLPTNSFSIINYSVTVTDVNLCKASDTAKVEVRNLPTVTISGEDKFCEGGQTTLTANLSGGFESSPLIWQWNDGSTTQNFQTSTSLTAANYTYAVTVSQNQNPGCSNSTTSMISVYPMPTFTLSTDDTNICTGGASSFSVSNIMGGVPGNPIKYTHSFNGTLAGEFTNSFTTQMIVNPGPIYIKVEADQDIFIGDGCTSQQLVTVQVSTDPVLTISGATNVCQGNSVNLTSSVTGGVQGGELYTWKRLSGTNETTLSDTDSQYTTDNTLLPGSYNYVVSVSQPKGAPQLRLPLVLTLYLNQ